MLADIWLFYPGKRFISAYVGGVLGGVVHSAIELVSIKENILLIEATAEWGKVSILPLSLKKGRLYEVYRLKNDEYIDYDKAINWVLQQVGKRYDFWQALGIKLKKPFGHHGRYICSELVNEFYKIAGVKLVENKPENLITPADFQKSGKLMKVKEGIV